MCPRWKKIIYKLYNPQDSLFTKCISACSHVIFNNCVRERNCAYYKSRPNVYACTIIIITIIINIIVIGVAVLGKK